MRSRAPRSLLTAAAATTLAAALTDRSPVPANPADAAPAGPNVLPTEHVHGLAYDPDGSRTLTAPSRSDVLPC